MLREIVVRSSYVRRAHAPGNHADSHDEYKKSNAWFSSFYACMIVLYYGYYGYGALHVWVSFLTFWVPLCRFASLFCL